MDDFQDPFPEAVHDAGGDPRAPSARDEAAGSAPHVEDHHFQHPTVAPVSRDAPAAVTPDW
jgi:hypothetical protein